MPASKVLTEVACRNAKPDTKDFKLFDKRGLYLLVKAGGSKLWRCKVRIAGRERLLSLGSYADVSLGEARELRDAQRKLIARGVDPIAERRATVAARQDAVRDVFEAVAERYFRKRQKGWSETHKRDIRRMFDNDLLPKLGRKSISEITTADVRRALEAVTKRGALTHAKDCKTYVGAIYKHFNSEREVAHRLPNPAEYLQLDDPPPERHHAHLAQQEIGTFLRKLTHAEATPLVRIAMRVLFLCAVRTGELRAARWDEIDSAAGLWKIPPGRMKARRAHLIPLAPQVLALFAELRTISGSCELIFPSLIEASQPISENTLIALIRRMGYAKKMTGHGARSCFSEWAHLNAARGGWTSDAIERQLAHAPRDRVKAAYLHTEFLDDRTKMLRAWADWCDEQERSAGNVVPIREAVA
jgi:integrase